jgi:hypothetical protein
MDHLKREIATWTRWVHIYLSMFSFAALLFFAVTGITLNHTNWLEGQQKVEQVKGDMPVHWVHPDSARVNELMVVEYLRNTHRVKAPLTDFTTEKTECALSFKGPGYAANGFVDRVTGHYELIVAKSGLFAIMNDLHKGRDAGTVWGQLIDVSAVLMILVSLTGFLMIFFLKRKRFSGLLLALAGALVIIIAYLMLV